MEAVKDFESPVVVVKDLPKDVAQAHNDDSACLTKDEISLLKSLGSTLDSLKASNSELNQKVTSLEDQCRSLKKQVDELEGLNRTFERELAMLRSEDDRTKRKMQQLVSEFATVSLSAASKPEAETVLKPTVNDASAGDRPSDVAAESKSEVEIARGELQKLGTDVISITTVVKGVVDKVTSLEYEFLKFTRRHCLIIENFCPKEDKSATEMFALFVNSVLDVKLEDGEVESVHVITQQGTTDSPEKRPRPILVTFSCYGTRSRVYKAWLGFRSSKFLKPGALSGERGSGICIREYLTETQESLYNKAIEVRDKHLIADCWTFRGKTYVRALDGEVKEFNKEQWAAKEIAGSGGCTVM